ncbi:hypothetical protein TNCV_800361 [Trichonephila clavipes]|nr:hypothetical protein TNCV_800361 [Trichonephila clavipes]
MSPHATYKFEGAVMNILRGHDYTEKHGQNKIKRHKDSVSRIVAAMMDIRATRSISELTGVLCTKLIMAPQRKEIPEEINKGIWEAKQGDHHAQSTCLEMSGPNGQARIFHNGMEPGPIETTYGGKQVQGHQ